MRILADVACDIGELHGDAEVGGAGQQPRRANPHQQCHHHADRARHARRIIMQLGEIAIAPPGGIPLQPVEQRLRQLLRNGEAIDDAGKRAVDRMIDGMAAIEAVEPPRKRPMAFRSAPLRSTSSSTRRQKA